MHSGWQDIGAEHEPSRIAITSHIANSTPRLLSFLEQFYTISRFLFNHPTNRFNTSAKKKTWRYIKPNIYNDTIYNHNKPWMLVFYILGDSSTIYTWLTFKPNDFNPSKRVAGWGARCHDSSGKFPAWPRCIGTAQLSRVPWIMKGLEFEGWVLRYSLIILKILCFFEFFWNILTDASEKLSYWCHIVRIVGLLLSLHGPEWPTQFEKLRSLTSPMFYYVASCQLHGQTFSNWRTPKISQLIPWLQADPTNVAQHGLSKGSTVLAPLAIRLRWGWEEALESWRFYTLDLWQDSTLRHVNCYTA